MAPVYCTFALGPVLLYLTSGAQLWWCLQDIQVRRQRRLSSLQPDETGAPIASPGRSGTRTPPRGISPAASPPRSPMSVKSVTFAPVPAKPADAPSTVSTSSSGSRSSRGSQPAAPAPPPLQGGGEGKGERAGIGAPQRSPRRSARGQVCTGVHPHRDRMNHSTSVVQHWAGVLWGPVW